MSVNVPFPRLPAGVTPVIPLGPFDNAPAVRPYTADDRETARQILHQALRDLPYGVYDQMIVGWLTQVVDPAALITLASLIERARLEGGSQ